jgi:hypothetical protein
MNVIKNIFVLFSIVGTLAVFSQAARAQEAKPGPEHKKLEILVGEFTYEGTANETPLGPKGTFQGKLGADFVLDGFFVGAKWEEKNPTGTLKGIEMHGYNPATKTHTVQMFMSDGTQIAGTTAFNKDGFTSEFTAIGAQGKKFPAKGEWKYAPDRSSFTGKWQISLDDGKTWVPWLEYTMKRVK